MAEPHLGLVCESRVAGDNTYYRLSEKRVGSAYSPCIAIRN